MKLSDKTINLLKNFSNINQSLLFKQGNKLRTISVMKNILAEATVEEEFPKDFGIYDLPQFLNSVVVLYNNAEFDFANDNHVVIKEGRMKSKYFFADPSVIVTPPQEEKITLPSEDVTFEVSTEQLDKLLKAASLYQLSDLAVVGGDGVVKLLVRDKKNDASNDFSIIVGETNDVFSFNFKVENIKILPGNYEVVVSSKLLSRFTSKNQDLTYYIALEPDSTFG
tara:strand:+ start:73 stop:744 length:672 start_codon:yes stop_codon:yes gene_type:complete